MKSASVSGCCMLSGGVNPLAKLSQNQDLHSHFPKRGMAETPTVGDLARGICYTKEQLPF